MGKPKTPRPPDPAETAAAQTGTNINTAVANAQLGNIDSTTPYGSITYAQDPSQTTTLTDQEGNPYEVPKWTSTTAFSPTEQALYDQSATNQLGLGEFAGNQIDFLSDVLSKPFDGGAEATEARLMELGRSRLDPILADQDEALRTRLANQGITVGTEAYNREMELQGQSANDAYNQLILGGWGQSFNQGLQTYNNPVSVISALMSGSQPQQPTSPGFNAPNVANVDYAGLVNDNYNQRLAAANQQNAYNQNLFGGLFGAAAGLAPLLSDERTKEGAQKIGERDGINLYEYRYKDEDKTAERSVGVMAQEVEKTRPDAVVRDTDGYRRVKYGRLFGLGAT